MRSKTYIIFILLIGLGYTSTAQKITLTIDGELSAHSSFSPDSDLDVLLGARYLPELNLKNDFDSIRFLDFEFSANLYASSMFHPFDTFNNNSGLKPYRLWGRYVGKRYEIRVGLQKINFGSATLLRPLQWFDQIDPRDPLRFTNGVYGALGRYYFQNNANIWIWGLYGNDETRGFEAFPTHKETPELGGRVQYPVAKGEIALSGHYRKADLSMLSSIFPTEWTTPEYKIGLDGKWDVGVGLWFEATHTYKDELLNLGTHQSLFTLGTDYTFGIGNGVNLIGEHMLMANDKYAFNFEGTANITALMASYPLGFFDNLSVMGYYAWESEGFAAFLNYQHQFKHFTTYVIAFYTSGISQSAVEGNIANSYSGPGIQLMLVYNH